MRDGKHCPACGADIGVWPVFSAGLPTRVRCPSCKAFLGYQGTGAMYLVMLLALLAVLALASVVARSVERDKRPLVFVTVCVAAWVPVELASALYLRANKILADRSGGRPPAVLSDAGPPAPKDAPPSAPPEAYRSPPGARRHNGGE